MSFSTVDELSQWLTLVRLVEPEELSACLAELDYSQSTPAAFLDLLEKKHLLTTFQASKLKKGDTEGLVLGGYKLLYRNAAGSFARVFRACSIEDGTMIGLKVLRNRWAKDPNAIAEFRKEAEVCMKLRHPNIVPIYEVGSEEGYHFFTMEFVEGGNLRDFIRIRKKLEPVEATRFVLDMARGLAYAIRHGVTHRDLKMTNVLMSVEGVAKLADFGLAGAEESHSGEAENMQRALEYAAIEKGTGAPNNDPRSDLFFLGAIFYELVTGQPPYPPTKKRDERKQLSRYSNIRSVTSVDPTIPPAIAAIIGRLLTISPNDRYQSAAEVVGDLKQALRDLGEEVSDEQGDVAAAKQPEERSQPTVLCVETRAKQQDMLRDYLTKHGFRVLVLSDPQRAIMRLQNNPPDCIVLMGDAIGDEIVDLFGQAAGPAREKDVVLIAVLARDQARLASDFPTSEIARVVQQPATLRDLRSEIRRGFRVIKKDTGAVTTK